MYNLIYSIARSGSTFTSLEMSFFDIELQQLLPSLDGLKELHITPDNLSTSRVPEYVRTEFLKELAVAKDVISLVPHFGRIRLSRPRDDSNQIIQIVESRTQQNHPEG
jgi:hypothetical protein